MVSFSERKSLEIRGFLQLSKLINDGPVATLNDRVRGSTDQEYAVFYRIFV